MGLNMANKLPGGAILIRKKQEKLWWTSGLYPVDLCGPDFVSGSFCGVPDATPIGTAIETLRCKGRIQESHHFTNATNLFEDFKTTNKKHQLARAKPEK